MIPSKYISREMLSEHDIAKFWKYVNKQGFDEHWIWIGGRKDNGRGNIDINNQTWQAHRISWVIRHGEIPDGLFVLHSCDGGQLGCVNPDHLFLGTQNDNIQDMISKGRKVTRRGDDDPKSKLTEAEVREIKRLYVPFSTEYNQLKLAKIFKVSRSAILAILRGDNWKHVE